MLGGSSRDRQRDKQRDRETDRETDRQQPVHASTHTHPITQSSRQATQGLPSSHVHMDVSSCQYGGLETNASPDKPQHRCCNAQQQQKKKIKGKKKKKKEEGKRKRKKKKNKKKGTKHSHRQKQLTCSACSMRVCLNSSQVMFSTMPSAFSRHW